MRWLPSEPFLEAVRGVVTAVVGAITIVFRALWRSRSLDRSSRSHGRSCRNARDHPPLHRVRARPIVARRFPPALRGEQESDVLPDQRRSTQRSPNAVLAAHPHRRPARARRLRRIRLLAPVTRASWRPPGPLHGFGGRSLPSSPELDADRAEARSLRTGVRRGGCDRSRFAAVPNRERRGLESTES